MKLKEIMDDPSYDKNIVGSSLVKWKKIIKGIKCTNYEMVIYNYKNQVNAKNSY